MIRLLHIKLLVNENLRVFVSFVYLSFYVCLLILLLCSCGLPKFHMSSSLGFFSKNVYRATDLLLKNFILLYLLNISAY